MCLHISDLTIAIDGVTEVHLPTNEVRLFASSWPNPPGVRFHWTRVSGRKEGVLNGMNDASVVLSEVMEALYVHKHVQNSMEMLIACHVYIHVYDLYSGTSLSGHLS